MECQYFSQYFSQYLLRSHACWLVFIYLFIYSCLKASSIINFFFWDIVISSCLNRKFKLFLKYYLCATYFSSLWFMISGINLVKPINSDDSNLNYQFSLVLMKKYKAFPKNTKHTQFELKGELWRQILARRSLFIVEQKYHTRRIKMRRVNFARRTNLVAIVLRRILVRRVWCFCATIRSTSSRKYILGLLIV